MAETRKSKRERTEKFIEKYLAIGPLRPGLTCYGMMADARGTSQSTVATHIKQMDYADFMGTIYWQLVAWQVKHDNGWRCSITGRRGHLEVHHQNYDILGFEIFHLDRFTCVCRAAHRRIHAEMAAKQAAFCIQKETAFK